VKQVFPLAQAPGGGVHLQPLLPLLILVPILLVAWYLISAPRLVRFEISPQGLRIRGDLFYSRTIAASELMLEGARPLDLSATPEYKPKWRTNGTGLPGYKAGWFKLQNGQKALLFVGDSKRVVYIPVRSGYSLLLSVTDAEQFLAALHNAVAN
jgi:hypothetical protein